MERDTSREMAGYNWKLLRRIRNWQRWRLKRFFKFMTRKFGILLQKLNTKFLFYIFFLNYKISLFSRRLQRPLSIMFLMSSSSMDRVRNVSWDRVSLVFQRVSSVLCDDVAASWLTYIFFRNAGGGPVSRPCPVGVTLPAIFVPSVNSRTIQAKRKFLNQSQS